VAAERDGLAAKCDALEERLSELRAEQVRAGRPLRKRRASLSFLSSL
jgi:hypothetical protein